MDKTPFKNSKKSCIVATKGEQLKIAYINLKNLKIITDEL